MRFRLEQKIIGAFVIALVLLVGIAIVSFYSILQLREDIDQVKHSQEILTRLESILSTGADAETGHRGFAITGGEVLLEPYRQVITEMQQEESQSLRSREAKTLESSRFALATIVTGGLLAFTLVGVALAIVHHGFAERRRAEDQLEQTNRELRIATEQAQQANQLKSAFLSTMSHELRTPLSPIIGFTGIILQGLAGPLNPEQAKQLGIVQDNARHLLALINDVLDISKLDAGELKVDSKPFDLHASITRVAGVARPVAEKKGLTLRVELPPPFGPVTGDRPRVEQVLLQLLDNAIKFTERGEVALTAALTPGFVRMCITDTGIGIKPENMNTLFLPFRRIDSGLSRSCEGAGLGLAICRRLANLMGGEIRAESEWGKGSTFSFTLPLKRPVTS
jgi:signal transduction histidine kinase